MLSYYSLSDSQSFEETNPFVTESYKQWAREILAQALVSLRFNTVSK